MGILIFILFILNILLIFCLILLFVRQNRLFDLEKKQRQIQAESEEMLAGFLLELKEENDKFISKVVEIQHESLPVDHSSKDKNQENVPYSDIEKEEKENTIKLKTDAYSRLLTKQSYEKPDELPQENHDAEENDHQSMIEKVLFLHNKGISTEKIAKQLGKGKTEIELLLKFHRK